MVWTFYLHLALRMSLPLILLFPNWMFLLWFLPIFPTSKHLSGRGLNPGLLCPLSGWCHSVSLLCVICVCFRLPGLLSPVHTSLLNYVLLSTSLTPCLAVWQTSRMVPNSCLPPIPAPLPFFPVSLNDNFIRSFAQDKRKWSYPWLPFLTTLNAYPGLSSKHSRI